MNTTVKSLLAVTLLVVCTFVPSVASADEGASSYSVPELSAQPGLQAPGSVQPYGYHTQLQAPTPQTITKRYGLQILAADAAAWALVSATQSEEAMYAVFLGGPAVHLAHGEGGKALGSLGVRVAAPIGLAALFVSGCEDEGNYDCIGNALGGLMLGYAGAVAFDALVLAKKEVEVKQPIFTPMVAVNGDSASVGLGGRF